MTTKKPSAAIPPKRSPRNTSLFAIAIGSLILAIGAVDLFMFSGPNVADQVRSVTYVHVDVEEEVHPFLFFFGPGRLELPVAPFTNVSALLPPPPTTQVQHYLGTAFKVNGRLLTCKHVAAPHNGKVLKITLSTFDGREAEARTVRTDERNDLAELTTSLDIPTLRLASKPARRNDVVTEIGHPNGMPFVVSKGLVAAFDREQGYNIAALDTFGGNSGGPVINSAGEVVGMTHTLLSGSRFTGIGTLESLRDFLYPDATR